MVKYECYDCKRLYDEDMVIIADYKGLKAYCTICFYQDK